MKKDALILILMLIASVGIDAQSHLGGYGELHYNVDQTKDTKTLDFHRFVLFYYHSWNEEWSFVSEVELEHNFIKDGQGELELEQAYVDFQPNDWFGFRAGVVLPSVGIINETHEPPTFLSVERPDYSKVIIPTTWFGNGMAVYGGLSDFSYQLTVMEGLNADGFSLSSGIRGGRQKGYKSNGENLLINGRVDYEAVPGLKVGSSFSIADAFSTENGNVKTELFELHAQWSANHIYATAEYGLIGYDAGQLKSSKGYYVDLGYNIASWFDFETEVIPWVRWTDYNPASDVRGTDPDMSKAYHAKKWLVGVMVRPFPQVAFKVDYGIKTIELEDKQSKQFNMGVGYMFH